MRNSTLYSRFSYIKKRRSKRFSLYFSIISVLIILTLFVSYTQKRVIPYIVEISEFRARSIMTMTVYNAVGDYFDDKIEYEDIVNVNRNNKGNITSIKTDIAALNTISSNISTAIQNELATLNRENIAVPFGILLGDTIFSGVGPDLYIRITPFGNVETDFKSEVTPLGKDKTRHRLYLQVKTRMAILIPMLHKNTEITTNIPVAESVIAGKIDEDCLKELIEKTRL